MDAQFDPWVQIWPYVDYVSRRAFLLLDHTDQLLFRAVAPVVDQGGCWLPRSQTLHLKIHTDQILRQRQIIQQSQYQFQSAPAPYLWSNSPTYPPNIHHGFGHPPGPSHMNHGNTHFPGPPPHVLHGFGQSLGPPNMNIDFGHLSGPMAGHSPLQNQGSPNWRYVLRALIPIKVLRAS